MAALSGTQGAQPVDAVRRAGRFIYAVAQIAITSTTGEPMAGDYQALIELVSAKDHGRSQVLKALRDGIFEVQTIDVIDGFDAPLDPDTDDA